MFYLVKISTSRALFNVGLLESPPHLPQSAPTLWPWLLALSQTVSTKPGPDRRPLSLKRLRIDQVLRRRDNRHFLQTNPSGPIPQSESRHSLDLWATKATDPRSPHQSFPLLTSGRLPQGHLFKSPATSCRLLQGATKEVQPQVAQAYTPGTRPYDLSAVATVS